MALFNRIYAGIVRRVAAPIRSIYLAWAAAELRKKIAGKFNQSPHGLPSELIVPLHPTLHVSILCI